MKTDKELGEIGANAAFKAGVDAKNRAPWLLCVSRVTTYGDSREKTWNEDGPCRTAFAAVVREEIFADVDGMPSVEECVAAEDTGGIEAIRNLMLAAFAKQMEEKDAELEIFKRIRDAKIELQAKYDDLQVTMDSVTMNANWSIERMNKAESKLAAAETRLAEIAKLPDKWRKNRAEPWELIQDLEAALGSLPMEPVPEVPADPLPAGKLSDEQLGVIGLRAANSCNHQVKFYENFARAVREAVEKECNRSMQNGLYQAIVNKLKPILGENSRELEWDILHFTLGKLIAAKRIPDAGQAKKIGEQAEEIARLTAKSEEMCQAFVAEAAKKHEALAIIEQAIEMVNTPGTTQDNLPKAINAKIIQRDEFHDATLKKLDAAKDEIKRLLQLDATNRENFDRTRKALVESQLLQLATQKALAKANAELVRLRWRPVRVKPTEADADSAGRITTTSKRGEAWQVPWHTNLEGTLATHWRPFCPPPIPTAEEKERAEFEAAFPNLLKALTPSGMYASKKSQAMWESWQARASEEVKA